MTLSRRAFVAASAATLASTALPGRAAPGPLRSFAPAQLEADLDFLAATMIEVGVNPFVYTSRGSFDAALASVRSGLAQPLDVFAFYGRIAPVFTSLDDGHLGLTDGDAFKQYRDAGGTAFPLQVDLRASGAYAAETDVAAIPAGSKLLAIGGTDMSDVIDGALGLVSGQSRALRLAFAGPNSVRSYLFAKDGPRPTYAVTVLRPDGTAGTVVAPASTRAQLTTHMPAAVETDAPDYTYARIANGRIGYIDYRSCTDRKKFDAFLHDTFSQIASQPVAGLVIDIRENGGGDSSLNDLLWGYVTDKPFTQFGGYSTRANALLKERYGKQKYSQIYGKRAWDAPNGTVVTYRDDTPVAPPPNPLRYRGPVYLLIGVGTFSSAMACAVAAKDFGLATIVGEETAEPVNSNGELYEGTAPNTGLGFYFPTKYWFGPKPRPDGQGVVPDVTIKTTDSDIVKHRDPVLLYAVAQILGLTPM